MLQIRRAGSWPDTTIWSSLRKGNSCLHEQAERYHWSEQLGIGQILYSDLRYESVTFLFTIKQNNTTGQKSWELDRYYTLSLSKKKAWQSYTQTRTLIVKIWKDWSINWSFPSLPFPLYPYFPRFPSPSLLLIPIIFPLLFLYFFHLHFSRFPP